jgi:SSS family solute:Na+ symporter
MAEDMYRALWSWLICVLVTVVVSLMTKPKSNSELEGLVYGVTAIPSDGTNGLFQKPIFWAGVAALLFVILQYIFW